MRFGDGRSGGSKDGQVVGFWDWSTGGGNFWGKCGAPHCSCAKVRDQLLLRFGVVHGVGRGIVGNAACSKITLGNLVLLCCLIVHSRECKAAVICL